MNEEQVNEADQWELDGDCGKCRRKKYCRKACRAGRKRLNSIIHQSVMESVIKKTGLGPIIACLAGARK